MPKLSTLATSLALVSAMLGVAPAGAAPAPEERREFDVVIAGGSTAAFAAAVAAAEEGARVALLEPTDWVGGQLTSSGVPAVDEAWHKIVDPATKEVLLDVAKIARDRANMTPNFRAMLDATGNPGGGWVSNYCFEPEEFLEKQLLPLERKHADRLTVFRETVVKRVAVDRAGGRVVSITAIRRMPKPGVDGYLRLPSLDIPDWYSPEPSPRFDKEVLVFAAGDRPVVFLDATEWGEVLALSGARYLQGVEAEDGGLEGNDRCGQATVFDFVQRLNPAPVIEEDRAEGVEFLGFGPYEGRPDAWAKIWTYRRVRGRGAEPAIGDLSLQNWGYSARVNSGGNDYPFGYLFIPRDEAAAGRDDWQGGVDLAVMKAAERRAFGWHQWFRDHPGEGFEPGQVTLEVEALGTRHGLAKLPYIRDTRRAVGLDGFILKFADLSGPASRKTGTQFPDRVALGAYPADVHGLVGCDYPAYVNAGHDTLPFLIPFRALTVDGFGNLLVAGKTMAQGFLANSATRLHPIEWSTGTAAGVAAAAMTREGWTSRQALENIVALRARIREHTPTEWTIDGKLYPEPDAAR